MKLRAPKKVLLPPIRANEGVRMAYYRVLSELVKEVHSDFVKRVLPIYKDLPEIAMDKATLAQCEAAMDQLAKEWKKNMASTAKKITKAFTDGAMKATDSAFSAGLRNAGFTVKMQMSEPVKVALEDVIDENIGLIKSIAEDHLGEVKEMVLESVHQGRNMKQLTIDLQERFDITKRRAALIARDQNNKATAHINRARQKEFHIEKARWVHTAASITPREEHEGWDGEEYDIDEGMYSEVDEEFVWPGTPINCGCTCMSIIPGYNDDESLNEDIPEEEEE